MCSGLCPAKFWTLPRWRCPRCSGQPPWCDDIHGKKPFPTFDWNFPPCSLCLLHLVLPLQTSEESWAPCSLHPPIGCLLTPKRFLLSHLPSRLDKASSASAGALCASAPQHLSSLWVNQCLRGTFISMEPKNGVFPLAALGHRCTARMKDSLPGGLQLSSVTSCVLTSPLTVGSETRQILKPTNSKQ